MNEWSGESGRGGEAWVCGAGIFFSLLRGEEGRRVGRGISIFVRMRGWGDDDCFFVFFLALWMITRFIL